jgi:hypothetical protein
MIKSETIGELVSAISKMQGVLEGAIKDSDNPFFRSKYADLTSVWEACRKPLTDNGLSIIQTSVFFPEQPELVAIETTIAHKSGEFITGLMTAKPVKSDPQAIGSCVTYLRRYSLAAICGIAPEDDDANAATGLQGKVNIPPVSKETTVKPPVTNKPTATPPVGNKSEPSGQTKIADAEKNPAVQEVKKAFPSTVVTDVKPLETPIGQPAEIADQIPGLVTPNQIDDIFRLIELAKLDKDRIGKILAYYKIKEFAELAEEKYPTLVKQLNTLIKK